MKFFVVQVIYKAIRAKIRWVGKKNFFRPFQKNDVITQNSRHFEIENKLFSKWSQMKVDDVSRKSDDFTWNDVIAQKWLKGWRHQIKERCGIKKLTFLNSNPIHFKWGVNYFLTCRSRFIGLLVDVPVSDIWRCHQITWRHVKYIISGVKHSLKHF